MVNEIRIGPQIGSDGATLIARAGKTGETAITNTHGFYYEPTYRGTIFNGAIVGQITTVGLATTYTGLCLSNPIGSTVNLVINKCGYAFTVAFAAASAIGLMTGYSASTNVTHTTPVTPRKQIYTGGGGGLGLLDSSATLPVAPTLNTVLGVGLTGAITTSQGGLGTIVDLDGSIILPPGGYCAFYTSTVSGTAAGHFSFSWEEVPI